MLFVKKYRPYFKKTEQNQGLCKFNNIKNKKQKNNYGMIKFSKFAHKLTTLSFSLSNRSPSGVGVGEENNNKYV